MKHRTLGRTVWDVSAVSMGCRGIGVPLVGSFWSPLSSLTPYQDLV